MATKTINIGSGQTYATLSAALAGEITSGVTADDYFFTIHSDITDNASMIAADWSTAASLTIECSTGDEHDGTPGSGIAITGTTDWTPTLVLEGITVTVRLLEIYAPQSGGRTIHSDNADTALTLHRCILDATAEGIYRPGGGSVITSNLFMNCGESIDTLAWNSITVANNAFVGATTGIVNVTNAIVLGDNNYCYGCTTSYTNDGTWTGDYNAADDAATNTPPGTNPITTDLVSGDFTSTATDDYSISDTDSTLYHAGDVVSGVTTDIAGNTFDASTPSVGAFELVSGGTIIPQASHHSNIILG